MQKVVKFKDVLFDKKIDLVIWCYSEAVPSVFDSTQNIEFHQGITEDIVSTEKLKNRSCLLVIDDLMQDIKSDLVLALFTKYR